MNSFKVSFVLRFIDLRLVIHTNASKLKCYFTCTVHTAKLMGWAYVFSNVYKDRWTYGVYSHHSPLEITWPADMFSPNLIWASHHWRSPYLSAFLFPCHYGRIANVWWESATGSGFSYVQYVFMGNLTTLSVIVTCMASSGRINSDWLTGKDARGSGRGLVWGTASVFAR
jgi:hypothetical protein